MSILVIVRDMTTSVKESTYHYVSGNWGKSHAGLGSSALNDPENVI